MEWDHQKWTIGKLLDVHSRGDLNLSPPYQRNDIWTAKAQRQLIDTVLKPQPIPSFFIRLLPDNRYEMVDGQQRARCFHAFHKGQIVDSSKRAFPSIQARVFLDYPLDVTLITRVGPDESIEVFYALVN